MLFRSSLLIAIILHALFLLTLSLVITFSSNKAEQSQKRLVPQYVPSYVYNGTVAPSALSQNAVKKTAMKKVSSDMSSVAEQGKFSHADQTQKSVLEMSREVLQQDYIQHEIQKKPQEEPMLLIGEISQYADPLIKLVGRSLSVNFRYPKMEGSFGVRGRVIVEMILHPEGYFSDVRIVQSSENEHFDAAALYAVNKAPTVVGANRLLSRPKYLVVGFIFN